MKNSATIISRRFILEVLEKESWFKKMIRDKACDLLLLTGTTANKMEDRFSDLDLFIVSPYRAQIKHKLEPVRVYKFEGKNIELSAVSTEKLFNDQRNKENLYWWHDIRVIKSYNKDAEGAIRKASTLSKREFLDRLWTNLVRFEINSLDITKQIRREEQFSIRLLFNENIKLVADTMLVYKRKFPQLKWFGGVLRRENPELYRKLILVQRAKGIQRIIQYNRELKIILTKILKNSGFTDDEINNWDKCNLARIIFQYK